jgi:PAS domain S-box-containing protein
MKKKKKKISRERKKENLSPETDPINGKKVELRDEDFFDKFPDLLAVISPDGYFKQLNPFWEKTIGFSTDELLASPVVVFVHPDDVEDTVQAMEETYSARRTVNFINRFRCRDGSYKWLLWHGTMSKETNDIFSAARDITAIKNKLIHLNDEHEKYRSLFENAPLEYISLDEDARITEVNKKWTETFGYSQNEIKGKFFGDLLEETDAEEFRNHFRILKDRGNVHADLSLIRKDGARRKIFFDGNIEPRLSGFPGIAFCIQQDITEREKHTLSLSQHEKNLRSVLESIEDAVMVIDTSGNVVISNERFSGMWGIPVEKLGLGEEESLMGFVVNRMKELKMIYHKSKEAIESTAIQRDHLEIGDGRIFEYRSFPWMSGNNILGRIILLRDESEKIRKEQERKESEERFRLIAEYSPDLIFISIGGRLQYINRRCETITGYLPEELCCEFDYLQLITQEHQATILEKLNLLKAGQPVDPFETTVISRKGNIVQTLVSLRLINYNGEKAVVGIVTDITEYQRSEKVEKQKVESLESYHKLMVGRELKMIELKKEVNKLLLLLGEEEKYTIVG